ncbi:hypothetical protein A2U01_0055524, partial [Trifolium medium]|nr:hypothetical protein [Trifolium medium]
MDTSTIVGDAFIPKKVDKWGRRFGFVKFREVKEVELLSKIPQDVWIGSFKLRVNKSRFHRNEESRRRDNDDESRRRDFQTQKVQLLSREE